MKANFKITDDKPSDVDVPEKSTESSELTEEEFEDYLFKSGAVGSFMVFRSNTKKDELGIDSL